MDQWTAKAPKTKGIYWFYGEFRGGMGCHYFDDPPPIEPKLHYVEVFKISNGLMAVAEGRFVYLNKFDKNKRREGYVGYWKKADLPKLPEDVDSQFT